MSLCKFAYPTYSKKAWLRPTLVAVLEPGQIVASIFDPTEHCLLENPNASSVSCRRFLFRVRVDGVGFPPEVSIARSVRECPPLRRRMSSCYGLSQEVSASPSSPHGNDSKVDKVEILIIHLGLSVSCSVLHSTLDRSHDGFQNAPP